MRRKFRLRNESQQHLGTVIYFFEDQILTNVGIIVTNDLQQKALYLYKDETIDEVINNLASKLNLEFNDYIEVN